MKRKILRVTKLKTINNLRPDHPGWRSVPSPSPRRQSAVSYHGRA
jgi:hypothetical protein